MKKQITVATMFLLLITGIVTGCKKETGSSRPLKTRIGGKWLVTKKETTKEGSPMETITGTSTDFLEFRGGDDDQIELSLGTEHSLGTYSVLATDNFNISFPGKLLNCTVNTIDDNNLVFTGTVNGSTPKVSEKYYLKR